MGHKGKASGFTLVTRSSLQIKDRTTMPPDRIVISYHQIQVDGTVKEVQGNWGDYLRDIDMNIVAKQHAPLNDSEKIDAVTIVTDVFPEGIPDPVFVPDAMLPY